MTARPLRILALALPLLLAWAAPAAATFPGANGKIAWNSTGPDSVGGTSDIFVADPPSAADPDGGTPVNLTRHAANDTSPDWSADGTRIAFDSDRDGDWEIYVMGADGSDVRQLTFNGVDDFSPSFSPDGTRIAFSSERSGDWEIWTMAVDGTDPTQLTASPGRDSEAAWSPDGSQIAFESGRAGNPDIWVMNADGTGQANLTRHPADDWWPSWSPGGGLLMFERWGPGTSEVYAMAADGSGVRNLTLTPGSIDRTAVLSPDGALVAYSGDAPLGAQRGLYFGPSHSIRLYLLIALASLYDTIGAYVGASFFDLIAAFVLGPASRGARGGRRGGYDRAAAAGRAPDSHPSWQPLPAADLGVEATGPARGKRGAWLAYTITAGSLRSGLPVDGAVLTATASYAVTASRLPDGCAAKGKRVRCALGTLEPWSSDTLELRLRAPSKQGKVTLKVALTGSFPDPGPAPNRVTVKTSVR